MSRSNIAPARTFPDDELPNHTHTIRKPSELQGDDPLMLTLARGHYCPKKQPVWGRPSVDDLPRELREVPREIHGDWDLSASELRDACNATDVSNLHGWDKRSPEEVAAERKRVAR